MTNFKPQTRTETRLTVYLCSNHEVACDGREIENCDHPEATNAAEDAAIHAAEAVARTVDASLDIECCGMFSDWKGGWVGGLRHGHGMARMIAEQRTITTTVDEDDNEEEDESAWQQVEPSAEMLKVVEAAADAYEAELCRFEMLEVEKAAKFAAEEAKEMEEEEMEDV